MRKALFIIGIVLFTLAGLPFALFLGLVALMDGRATTLFLAVTVFISFVGCLWCLIRMAKASASDSTQRLRTALAVFIGVPALTYCIWRNIGRLPEPKTPPAFVGNAQTLKETTVVPTLETPLPQGKNVIWCASLQLAWDSLKKNVVGEPIKIKGVEELVEKLNAGEFPANALENESYYAAAGWKKDGIAAKIQAEMQARFPDVTPDLSGVTDATAIAYAYLKAGLKFRIPYFENRKPFEFKDSSGKGVAVTSFGIREEDDYAYFKMRKQVKVLYSSRKDNYQLDEYAVDLDCDSKPYQLVAACIKPKATLKETLEYLSNMVKCKETGGRFGIRDVLLLPNMAWDITSRFRELEGAEGEACPEGLAKAQPRRAGAARYRHGEGVHGQG